MAHVGRTALLSAIGFIVLPLTLLAQAPTQQAKAGTSVRTQIESANKHFVALFNKGDVDGFAKVYAADAIVMPPNAEAIRGRSAIAKYWHGGWDAGVRNIVLTTNEVSVQGNTAYEMGTAQLEIKKPDGSVVGKDTAKYIVIWKRDTGGDWQWYRDIWNSNLPATAGK